MPEEKFSTLHPDGKSGRTVSKRKYEQMKQAITSLLKNSDYTLPELITNLEQSLKDTFFDNISWYSEVVLLDLEARNIVEKKNKYHLIK